MFTLNDKIILVLLIISALLSSILFVFVKRQKKKDQLTKIFPTLFGLILFWLVCSIIQLIYTNIYHANPNFIINIAYISVCSLPVAFFFTALIFAKTKIDYKPYYNFMFVIPILSLLLLWTNDYHHLFYINYSVDFEKSIYGIWFHVYYYYTMLLYAISLLILMKYSIKNSGLFSKQAVLILIGALVPIVTNLLGTVGVIPMSVYITPITFAFTIICLSLAVFRFNLFKVTPIALQTIVDRISDSYVVLNDVYEISDFNNTFITTFRIKDSSKFRGSSFEKFLLDNNLNVKDFSDHIEKILNNDKMVHFEIGIKKIEKNFNVEITSIIVNGQSLGILVLFKDITQHVKDMETLKNNQSMLMEQERLASLGQMVGGIAHNLKTPIMSISGASEGLKDLVNEFDASIGNPIVNDQDFHDIAKDMRDWLSKINSYTEYMSDILTAVKGQAVVLSEQTQTDFTLEELFKRVNILMKHELKQAVVYLNMSIKVDTSTIINGDINSLVQVINNMISNAIQSYNGKPESIIDLSAYKNNNNQLVISVRDYGCGIPDKVKKKLFKEMITTKGKNGTGLGLYMSYSTIKAHFNGDVTVESEPGKGTTFNIILP